MALLAEFPVAPSSDDASGSAAGESVSQPGEACDTASAAVDEVGGEDEEEEEGANNNNNTRETVITALWACQGRLAEITRSVSLLADALQGATNMIEGRPDFKLKKDNNNKRKR